MFEPNRSIPKQPMTSQGAFHVKLASFLLSRAQKWPNKPSRCGKNNSMPFKFIFRRRKLRFFNKNPEYFYKQDCFPRNSLSEVKIRDFFLGAGNFKTLTFFSHFQNAGRQGTTRETITGVHSLTAYCV